MSGVASRMRLGWLAYLPALGILGALAVIPVFNGDPYLIGVWTFILLNIIVILGIDLLLGYSGQLSLGHGLFVSIGAYTSALLTTKAGFSGWAAIPVGTLIAAVVGFLVAVPTLRLRGYYLAMATLALPIVFDAIVRVASPFTGGSSGVISIPRLKIGTFILKDPVHYYYFILIMLAPILVGIWRFANSHIGLELRAIHADETAAQARGIDVVKLKIAVFVLSAMLAALSGSLYVHNVQFVSPDTFGVHYSLTIVILLVVGGMGRIWGGIFGVIILMWIPEALRSVSSWQPVVYGSLLAGIMLFAPSGLAGLLQRRPSLRPITSYGSLRGIRNKLFHGDLLKVAGISRSFGGLKAVNDVSFQLQAGRIKALIGPNGAGKSTALALISGALQLDTGRLSFCGKSAEKLQAHERARLGVGRTFQHARLIPTLTVYENIYLGCSALEPSQRVDAGMAHKVSALLNKLGLEEVAGQYPDKINQFQRRLTELGAALVSEPRLLLLDEPAAGLSSHEIERLAQILREERDAGRAILLVDHVMQLVLPLADEIAVLEYGSLIAEGTPKEILENKAVQAAYLGRAEHTHA